MRFWDYFPHPVEHPGWFFTTLFIGAGLIAGLCGEADGMVAILATGIMLYAFVRISNGLYHAAGKDGFLGLLTRFWFVACVAWTFAFALVFGKTPKTEEFSILLAPWIGGPVLYKAVRFIVRGSDH